MSSVLHESEKNFITENNTDSNEVEFVFKGVEEDMFKDCIRFVKQLYKSQLKDETVVNGITLHKKEDKESFGAYIQNQPIYKEYEETKKRLNKGYSPAYKIF